MLSIPQSSHVLVIGGGPAGSTAATLLARQGYEVTLLELARFPRYHIGESLLPSALQIFDLLGIREKVENAGFTRKHGAFLEWGKESWPLNFGEMAGRHTYSFQVERSQFDQLLLEHARSQGVQVFEGVEVRSLNFEGDRPCSANWQVRESSNGDTGKQGTIHFQYLIDGSGRNGVMSMHYLRNRRYHNVFKNVALWGYWKGADRFGTGREGDIAVNSIPNGWLWAIPLQDDTMSVGVVLHRDAVNARRGDSLEQIYQDSIEAAPLVKKIVSTGELASGVHTESDYSYTADKFSGPGFFMCGDSACFLDPLLSSGVHLATFSGMLAAAAISSIEHGEISPEEASSFYEKSYRQAYLRFLVFLSAFYDVNRGRDSYFWEAQRLTEEDVDAENIKQAFLKLVTGIKDWSDTQGSTHKLILETMSERIGENLSLRKDKDALAALDDRQEKTRQENARFFDSVEGIFSLEKEEAIDGLYVATEPRLHLARV